MIGSDIESVPSDAPHGRQENALSAGCRTPNGGFGRLRPPDGSLAVAIETDKNLIVAALQAAGLTVYAINPRAVARYRERSAQAGGKSDPGDAILLANILRTDLPMHRALPRISEDGLAVKALAANTRRPSGPASSP